MSPAVQSPPRPTIAWQVVAGVPTQAYPAAHWSKFPVLQAPLVWGILQTPGGPPELSHQSPSRQGQAPLTSAAVWQVPASQVRPLAHSALEQLSLSCAKGWQVPGQVLVKSVVQKPAWQFSLS
jgi:hypothetical protein